MRLGAPGRRAYRERTPFVCPTALVGEGFQSERLSRK